MKKIFIEFAPATRKVTADEPYRVIPSNAEISGANHEKNASIGI